MRPATRHSALHASPHLPLSRPESRVAPNVSCFRNPQRYNGVKIAEQPGRRKVMGFLRGLSYRAFFGRDDDFSFNILIENASRIETEQRPG